MFDVIVLSEAFLPALSFEPSDHILLEVRLAVRRLATHAAPRRSIWPVTAAVIKAARRSRSKSMLFCVRAEAS